MINLKSICLKLCAVLVLGFTGVTTTVAYAQQNALPAPPIMRSIDANGVDLISGQYSVTPPSVSTAGISRGGQSYNSPYLDDLVGIYYGNSITIGGVVSENVGIDSTNENGSSMTCVSNLCTYKNRNGLVAIFDTNMNSSNRWPYVAAMMTQLTKPDGEVVKFYYTTIQQSYNHFDPYDFYGLKTVTSSLGWTIKYENQTNLVNDNFVLVPKKLYIVNTTLDYCDPNAATCTSSNSANWPTLNIDPTVNYAPIYKDINGTSIGTFGAFSTSLPSGIQKTVSYVTSGSVEKVKVGTSEWNYSYVDSGTQRTTTVTNPQSGTRVVVSNDGKLMSDQDELGRITKYTYDPQKRVEKVINPDATYSGATLTGGYTQYTYDGRGNVTNTTIVPKAGSGQNTITTWATYAACDANNFKFCNKPLTVTDAAGVTTTYTYSPDHGGVLTETAATVGSVSAQVRYSYSQITPYVKDSGGNLVAQTPVWRLTGSSSCMSANSCTGNTDELKTVVNYGANSNPTYKNVLPVSTTVSRGDGSLPQTTTNTYDINGNITIADGPKPGATDAVYSFYDQRQRPIGLIGSDPDGAGARPRQASRTTYNTDGLVSEQIHGTATGTDLTALNGMTVIERIGYDYTPGTGFLIRTKYFTGTSTTPSKVVEQSYDSLWRPNCQAERIDPSTFASLTSTAPNACVKGTATSEGNDRIVKSNYDAASALTSTVTAYDTGAPINNFVKTFSGANGMLSNVVDGKGNRTTYSYDGFNRLIKTCYPLAGSGGTSSTSDCEQIVYDNAYYNGARVKSVSLRDASTITLSYDAIGRISGKSGAVSESIVYNNFSQIISRTNNTTGGAAATSTYSYNALGWRMTDAQPLGTVSYEYDAYGKRTRMWWPSNAFSVTYGYDDGDELTGIYENGSAALTTFDYDNAGRRAHIYRGNSQTTTYGYDASSRLTSLNHPANALSLAYTQTDQVKTKTNSSSTFAPAAPSIGTTSYGLNGLNQIATVNGSTSLGYDTRGNLTSDGPVTYSYNINNLLTSTSVGASLSYDAENRLARMARSGYPTTRFLYDGADVIAEYDDAGTTVLRRYVHGPGMDEPLVWYEGSGTGDKRYYLADYQASITQVTNNAGGNVGVNTYDAYGLPGAGNIGRFQYTGQMWLPEAGLYYYKARLYSPSLGRFMQTDPIGYGDGMNWYAYVGNDPLNRRDPSGRVWIDCTPPAPPETMDAQGNPVITVVASKACYLPDFDVGRDQGDKKPRGSRRPIGKPVSTSALCKADYIGVTVTGGEGVIGGGSFAIDKFGNVYAGPVLGVGVALTPFGASIGLYNIYGNEYYKHSPVTAERINGVLTGFSINVTLAFGVGASGGAGWSGGGYGTVLSLPTADIAASYMVDVTQLLTKNFGYSPEAYEKALNGICKR